MSLAPAGARAAADEFVGETERLLGEDFVAFEDNRRVERATLDLAHLDEGLDVLINREGAGRGDGGDVVLGMVEFDGKVLGVDAAGAGVVPGAACGALAMYSHAAAPMAHAAETLPNTKIVLENWDTVFGGAAGTALAAASVPQANGTCPAGTAAIRSWKEWLASAGVASSWNSPRAGRTARKALVSKA